MKIKIIDLLNKNEEELPKKIKAFDTIFEIIGKNYYAASGDFIDANLFEFIHDADDLNSFVEILEADKKIEKISYADHVGIDLSEAVCNKLNEVIDTLNKLKADD
jgi:hypothetical protein